MHTQSRFGLYRICAQEADGAGEWIAKAKAFKGPIRRGAAALRLRWSVISPEATGARAEAAKAAKAAKSSSASSSTDALKRKVGVKARQGDKGTAAAAAHQAAEAAVRALRFSAQNRRTFLANPLLHTALISVWLIE